MLCVLIKHSVLELKQHLVAGMIHGVFRSLKGTERETLKHALLSTVVDVTYVINSKNVNAPNGHETLRSPKRVQSKCLNKESDEASTTDGEYTSINAEKSLDTRNPGQKIDAKDPKPIFVKADGAGSLTSTQDTADEMSGISVW
ncbi:hypothetical protein PsorP6_003514 [Peronosclerospora sorghi]|uniref:Uncharacterized protein n=1 Tax=Peronosclerospora sorghi TaxID=230839 RepID=A0ACC0VL34_9STRA|nr:hypothetical protein PsorP6_003514 [Peronosclerospora sorghi]